MSVWHFGGRRGRSLAQFVTSLALAGAGIALPVDLPAAVPTTESLPLAAAYGSGVHDYFAGQYDASYTNLSQAIEAGTTDPRAFYFRGLAALKLGRLDEAEADFSAGAAREAEGTGTWPIARSLERVQGCDRLKLERHRVRARVAALQENRRRNELRYLDIERAEPDTLRRRRPVLERAPAPGNPFAEPVPAAELPAAESIPAEAMPVPEDDARPGDEPADPLGGADPFGTGSEPGGDEQVEKLAAERENVAEQVDQQMEQEVSEFENAAGQRDGQAEAEAAGR